MDVNIYPSSSVISITVVYDEYKLITPCSYQAGTKPQKYAKKKKPYFSVFVVPGNSLSEI